MADFNRLFQESLTGVNQFEKKLTPRFEYADLYTFAQNKVTPVYNWFYYKEGYSRDFVLGALKELDVPTGSQILDPFCGTGTTLLAAKEAGYGSVGFDILPLGVFVSKVKLEDYDVSELREAVSRLCTMRYRQPESKLVDIRFLDMRKVFTPYARNDIAFFRENIMAVEDEKVRNFLMLGLISIVGQASNVMKDGGVLRLVRKNHMPPVRHLLKNKLKRMVKDVEGRKMESGVDWSVDVGDARNLQLDDASVDAMITSPPYLNFVDYTKVYALELSLLLSSTKELENFRRRTMRSHIGAEYERKGDVTPTDVLGRVTGDAKTPVIVEGYMRDLYMALQETKRVLKPGGCAVYVVGNVSLPGITVDVDLMLAELGEKIGLQVEDIWVGNVRWADVHDIKKERPARESAVVLRRV
ncbi:MAG: DNA methyltransferase [Candidatus Altiarchaeota archaeon]